MSVVKHCTETSTEYRLLLFLQPTTITTQYWNRSFLISLQQSDRARIYRELNV